jgi:hypothetical protein
VTQLVLEKVVLTVKTALFQTLAVLIQRLQKAEVLLEQARLFLAEVTLAQCGLFGAALLSHPTLYKGKK